MVTLLWHLPSSLCVDLCFPFVLGKYLDVEWLGYMHAALHPVPSWGALEAPSLFSHPLIPVLKFCCPALLWVTTTRVSASGLRSVGLPRLLLRLRSILFSVPRACVFPTFPKILWTPFQQGGWRPTQPAPLVELQCRRGGGGSRGGCCRLKRQIPRLGRFSWVNVSEMIVLIVLSNCIVTFGGRKCAILLTQLFLTSHGAAHFQIGLFIYYLAVSVFHVFCI